MKIGAMVESFRLGLDGGLKAAAELGVDGVQMYAVGGKTHPDRLVGAERARLRRRVKDLGLEFSAICGDFGGHGFTREDENSKRIDDSRRVMDLAMELGCSVVTTHIGVIPEDRLHPRYSVLARACESLGRHGEKVGATFAIETGPETAITLRGFLDDIGVPGVGVNFDPANLVMVWREDIPSAVRTLDKYIVHTHAKDGENLHPVNAEKLYNSFAEGGIEGFHAGEFIREVALGVGQVDWPAYIAALRAVKYDGYLTIEREVGDDPRKDIAEAVAFLKKRLAE